MSDHIIDFPASGRIRVRLTGVRRMTFAAIGDEFACDPEDFEQSESFPVEKPNVIRDFDAERETKNEPSP